MLQPGEALFNAYHMVRIWSPGDSLMLEKVLILKDNGRHLVDNSVIFFYKDILLKNSKVY